MIEKFADEGDMATQLQAQANEQAVARSRAAEAHRVAQVKAAKDDGAFDGSSCIVCEDEIPQERLDANHMHCTPCAQQIEDKKKRNGR